MHGRIVNKGAYICLENIIGVNFNVCQKITKTNSYCIKHTSYNKVIGINHNNIKSSYFFTYTSSWMHAISEFEQTKINN